MFYGDEWSLFRRHNWMNLTTTNKQTVKHIPLVMETPKMCSLFDRDILRVSSTTIECPYHFQCHRPTNVPIESLVMSHNFPIPCEPHPILIRPIQRLQYNVLLPSCYLLVENILLGFFYFSPTGCWGLLTGTRLTIDKTIRSKQLTIRRLTYGVHSTWL